MIRVTRCLETYPNKSIIEDLVTREGAPTEDSFTPFEGKKSTIDAQFSGSQRHNFKLNDFLEFVQNRDLDPSRATIAETHGMLEDSEKSIAGYKTLEDMILNGVESEYVDKYVIMMCVGFKKDKESPYRKNRDKFARTIRNNDGDDDEVEEKYLLERVDENISNEEYEETLRELPYLIKSIWSYSKQYQGNIFSFAFAYADILEHNGNNPNVSIQDFKNYKTYCINRDGSFKKQFNHGDDNKYVIYPNLTKIFIAAGSHSNVFNTCMKFLNSLKILGIDYRDEDPLQFNNDFMARLVCTYLPGNKQYMKEYKDVDPEILVALQPENIFATMKSAVYVPIEDSRSTFDYRQSIFFISECIDMAYKLTGPGNTLFDDRTEDSLALLTEYMRTHSGNQNITIPYNLLKFHPYTGMLYMKDQDARHARGKVQDYFLAPGKYFGTFKGKEDYFVVFTKYGFIVALEEEYDNVYYLEIEECYNALEAYNADKCVQGEANWKSLGAVS